MYIITPFVNISLTAEVCFFLKCFLFIVCNINSRIFIFYDKENFTVNFIYVIKTKAWRRIRYVLFSSCFRHYCLYEITEKFLNCILKIMVREIKNERTFQSYNEFVQHSKQHHTKVGELSNESLLLRISSTKSVVTLYASLFESGRGWKVYSAGAFSELTPLPFSLQNQRMISSVE